MTETSCVISSMDEDDNLSGHVGSPNPACGELIIINKKKMFWIIDFVPKRNVTLNLR